MRRISAAELRKLEALAPELRMMTVAPELPGMDRLLAAAKQQQILLSAGHSRATLADFRRFLAAGFCHLTHFGNQMSALHQRELGLMGAGLFLAETFCEVIGDSRHTDDEFVELLFRSKHGRRIALVSDCIPSSFAHSGQLQRSGLARRDRLLQTADGTIAGGETMLLSQVRHLKERTSIPMVQLVNAVSRIPRQFLSITERPRRFLAVDEKFQVIFVNS
jgi:N-acetylglucosamine-6-phosphate deacetylase